MGGPAFPLTRFCQNGPRRQGFLGLARLREYPKRRDIDWGPRFADGRGVIDPALDESALADKAGVISDPLTIHTPLSPRQLSPRSGA